MLGGGVGHSAGLTQTTVLRGEGVGEGRGGERVEKGGKKQGSIIIPRSGEVMHVINHIFCMHSCTVCTYTYVRAAKDDLSSINQTHHFVHLQSFVRSLLHYFSSDAHLFAIFDIVHQLCCAHWCTYRGGGGGGGSS